MKTKTTVGTAAMLAVAAALVALACTCSTCGLSDFSLPSLGGGGSSDEIAMYEELLEHEYEDPFDPDLLVMADDDGDGLPEASYPLTVEEEVAPGVYLDRWLYLDPQGEAVEDIEGTLQLVLENTTDEAVDVTFVDEIPKDVLERIEPGDIRAEPPVEIVILDEDPRYEVRVWQFAGGLRQTIAETTVDAQPASDAATSKKLVDLLDVSARKTSRSYQFLQRAKRCVALSEPGAELTTKEVDEEAWCNLQLIYDFPEKFTPSVCDEAAIYPQLRGIDNVSYVPEELQDFCVRLVTRSCLEITEDPARAACLKVMRRESYIECMQWPAEEQEHCRVVADRSHAENCSMMIADRASRRACCEVLSGELKEICQEDGSVGVVAGAQKNPAAGASAGSGGSGSTGGQQPGTGATGPGSPGGPGGDGKKDTTAGGDGDGDGGPDQADGPPTEPDKSQSGEGDGAGGPDQVDGPPTEPDKSQGGDGYDEVEEEEIEEGPPAEASEPEEEPVEDAEAEPPADDEGNYSAPLGMGASMIATQQAQDALGFTYDNFFSRDPETACAPFMDAFGGQLQQPYNSGPMFVQCKSSNGAYTMVRCFPTDSEALSEFGQHVTDCTNHPSPIEATCYSESTTIILESREREQTEYLGEKYILEGNCIIYGTISWTADPKTKLSRIVGVYLDTIYAKREAQMP